MADVPLGKVADCLLENEEYVDTYADLRKLCSNWRTLEGADLHLHNWIILDHALPRIAEFTFFNLGTGRCVTIDLNEVHESFIFLNIYRVNLFFIFHRKYLSPKN